ncbi:MAG TPA: TAT-variant-translocated molybdopterin oxidoreductase [Pseudobdellovibrionaceae bacterium]|nr:TAT-variant-translocated molybdopterin oxidoreductase [Pseudobdellovibrionaceae bacterium]
MMDSKLQAGHQDSQSKSPAESGPAYWLSLEELEAHPGMAERYENEFMASPLSADDNGFARRDFLKVMGASLALATSACVRRPAATIIPYAKAPKEITPGEANFYTSSWFDGYEGAGLLVKTLEGRPIKLEGNPQHPINLGALSARAHAEVLSLYDPDRLRGPRRNLVNKDRSNSESVSTKFEEADAAILEVLKKGGVALVTGSKPSPSVRAIIGDFSRAFGVRWVEYDALSLESVREGQRLSYGRAVLPRYRFDLAQFVVSIDADFLGTLISPVEFTKQWSKRRTPGADMSRLVCFESTMSLTGMNADDRVRIRPSRQLDVAFALLNRLARKGATMPAGLAESAKAFSAAEGEAGLDPMFLDRVADELWKKRGTSLVLAGGLATATAQQLELQVVVNALNSVLGNDGKTVDHDSAVFQTYSGSAKSLATLIQDVAAGKVKTLIIDDLDLMTLLPKDSGFAEAIKKLENLIYTGNRNDATGRLSNWVLPVGSSLETWGDLELQSGIYSIQQPTIMPMYDTRSLGELLLAWTKAGSASARVKASETWLDYVKATWSQEIQSKTDLGRGKAFNDFWIELLQTGVAMSGGRRERTSSARAFVGRVSVKPAPNRAVMELVLHANSQMMDGRYANVPWLQELPDPVSKVVWDNYLAVSPAWAREQGVKQGDVIEITSGDFKMRAPAWIQPGLHDAVCTMAVGYGRKGLGKVAEDSGFDAYQAAMFNAGQPIFSGRLVELKKTKERYELVSTQIHHVMENRPLSLETTKAAFEKDQGSGIHRHHVFTIWPEHQYTKHKWAMTVDLNSCTGCSACVVACSSENNVQVVGKRYVMEGREMHWIRIDRYYKGDMASPDTVFQPVMCQHCENAPCETVCPVLATVHNDEGLNDMAYNRCVGTRYCANNCPYKVRRFNWFNYVKKRAEPLHMAYNPDVTVRTRGVMEKCTFCVQRIRRATNVAKDEKRPLRDGEIKTACQETCPADAIVFGDLNNKESRVAKLFAEKRAYTLLEELNNQPRVRYLTRVRHAERVDEKHGHGGGHAAGRAEDRQDQTTCAFEGGLV